MFNAVIVDAIRTPLGRRNGKLKDWHPVDLMAETMKHSLSALVLIRALLTTSSWVA